MSDDDEAQQQDGGDQPQDTAAQGDGAQHDEHDQTESNDPEELLTHAGQAYMDGQFQQAIEAGQRVLGLGDEGQLARAYYGIALCYQELHDFASAADAMTRLLALPPTPTYPSFHDYQKMLEGYQRGQPWQGDVEPAP